MTNNQRDVDVDTATCTTLPRIFPTMADVIMPMLDVLSLVHVGATSKDMHLKFLREVRSRSERVVEIKQEIARLLPTEPNNNNNLEESEEESYHPPSHEDIDKAFALQQKALALINSGLSICMNGGVCRCQEDLLFSLHRKLFRYHPDHDYDNAAADEVLPLLPRIFYQSNHNDNDAAQVVTHYHMMFDDLEPLLNRLLVRLVNHINNLDIETMTALSWSSTSSSSHASFVRCLVQVEESSFQVILQKWVECVVLTGLVEEFLVKARRRVCESIRRHGNNILPLLDPYMYLLTEMDQRLADLAAG